MDLYLSVNYTNEYTKECCHSVWHTDVEARKVHTVYTLCYLSACGNICRPYCSGVDLLMSCWCMPTDGVFSLCCWLLMWKWQLARMKWLCGFSQRDSIIILIYSIVYFLFDSDWYILDRIIQYFWIKNLVWNMQWHKPLNDS